MNRLIAFSCAALILLVAGCGGSGPSPRGGAASATGEFPGQVAQAESTFRPSDFGIETWKTEEGTVPETGEAGAVEPAGTAQPDTIPGFRVQVSITGDIDAANTLRDSLSAALHGEWVYVVHHPPYYKIRVGNFAERFAAGDMLDRLRRQGFPDAWIVPDRVVRNAPPRSSPVPPDTAGGADPPR